MLDDFNVLFPRAQVNGVSECSGRKDHRSLLVCKHPVLLPYAAQHDIALARKGVAQSIH